MEICISDTHLVYTYCIKHIRQVISSNYDTSPFPLRGETGFCVILIGFSLRNEVLV